MRWSRPPRVMTMATGRRKSTLSEGMNNSLARAVRESSPPCVSELLRPFWACTKYGESVWKVLPAWFAPVMGFTAAVTAGLNGMRI